MYIAKEHKTCKLCDLRWNCKAVLQDSLGRQVHSLSSALKVAILTWEFWESLLLSNREIKNLKCQFCWVKINVDEQRPLYKNVISMVFKQVSQ